MSSPLKQNTTTIQELLNTINSLPEATEQVMPVISVSSNGLITATAGAKTSTHQLAFQAAKTITPSTSSQIAVSSGYYTGGNITVKGDANLVAGNIKSGVSIFGVNGTYAGSGGSSSGDTSMEDGLVTRTLTSYTNSRITSVSDYAFYYYSNLVSVSFPACTNIGSSTFQYCRALTSANFPNAIIIGSSAFNDCRKLTTISFPNATSILGSAFRYCYSLTSASFPKATTIVNYAFGDCSQLTTVSFPSATNIGGYAFYRCYNLKSLYLTGSSVCKLSNSNAFSSTPIGGYSTSAGTYGKIYVPTSLLTSYKRATNWTYFSSRFIGI